MAIEEILDLEQLEVNIYRGAVFSPESGFLQRTFGGHILGQSLVSAIRTVEPKFETHSLHGYFLRPGDATEPAVYLVDRPRDGGSFCTRRVNAVQHGEVIFSMGVSFQTEQQGIEHQDAMPDAPPPDAAPGFRSSGRVFDDAGFAQFAEWDIRIVPRDELALLPGKASQQQVWFKHREPLPDDPVLHACIAVYVTDIYGVDPVLAVHGHSMTDRSHHAATTDSSMWFHRPIRADRWNLLESRSPAAANGRGVMTAGLFDADGQRVATTVHEGQAVSRAE
jgi:acyl-CoA thioesterase-2